MRLNTYTARAEHLIGWSEVEFHVGEIKFLLTLCFKRLFVFRSEELAHRTIRSPLLIFLWRHIEGRLEEILAQLRSHSIRTRLLVVIHIGLEVLGILQVCRGFFLVLALYGSRANGVARLANGIGRLCGHIAFYF